jgi:glycosyltransferase involved in cell wall biosynthesis
MTLSILIPAYNDAETIETVVRRAFTVAKDVATEFEIIVCDDASHDKTSDIIFRLKKQTLHVERLVHAKNKGYGETIKELYYAGKYEWLFTVPGDFQIDPMELRKLVMYQDSADMIIGWRKNRRESPERQMQTKIYNMFLRTLFQNELRDINSVRLVKRSVIDTVKPQSLSAFVDAELTIGALKKGFKVIEVPIVHKKRETEGAGGGKASVIIPTIIDMIRYWLAAI